MNTFPRRTYWFVSCLTLGLVGLTGCGASSTPETVFATWSSAVQAGDFRGAWECLTPQTRGTVLQIMVLDADLLSEANAAAKTAFDQAFQKHGLNPQDPGFAQQRLAVTDPAELAADLDNVYRQYQTELAKLPTSRYSKLNAIWTASAQASISPSKMEGTRATAAVQGKIPHTPDNASLQAVFEKVNSQWLFSELEAAPAAAAMAGAAPGMPGAAGAAMPGMSGSTMPGMPGGTMPSATAPGTASGTPLAMAGNPSGAMPATPGGIVPAGPGGASPAGALPGGVDPKSMISNAPGGAPTNPGGTPPAGAMPAFPGGKPPAGVMPANPGGTPPAGAMPAFPGGKPPAGAMPANPGGTPPAGAMPAFPGGKPPAGVNPKDMPAKPANPGADNPAMANPGIAGAPNNGGAGIGGNGAGNQKKDNQYKQGSLEYVVTEFAAKMAEGDYSGMDYLISAKAKGLLADIRDGEISDEKKDELKATFANAAPQENSRKNKGSAVEISVKGKLGHMIQLTIGKEDGVFKIKEMKIHEPGATKKR